MRSRRRSSNTVNRAAVVLDKAIRIAHSRAAYTAVVARIRG
jgi:hypothetical protein